MIKRYLCLLFFSVLPLLSACANDFQKLEAEYFAGRYLSTLELALKAYENPELNPKVSAFLQKQGPRFLEKIDLSVQQALSDLTTDAGLRYTYAIINLYRQILTTKIPLSHDIIQKQQLSFQQKYNAALSSYLKQEEKRATASFSQEKFREAVTYANHVLTYLPQQKTMLTLKEVAEKKAKRVLYLMPSQHQLTKSQFLLQGLNISDQLTLILANTLRQEKSKYLSLSSSSENAHYTLHTEFLITEKDSQLYPIKEIKQDALRYLVKEGGVEQWVSTISHYEILSAGYECTLSISATLLHPSQKSPHTFKVQKTIKRDSLFKGKPMVVPANAIQIQYPSDYTQLRDNPIPIDKQQTIKDGLALASQELIRAILSEIDQDK